MPRISDDVNTFPFLCRTDLHADRAGKTWYRSGGGDLCFRRWSQLPRTHDRSELVEAHIQVAANDGKDEFILLGVQEQRLERPLAPNAEHVRKRLDR